MSAPDYSKHYIVTHMVKKPSEPEELPAALTLPAVNNPTSPVSSLVPDDTSPIGFSTADAFLTAMSLLVKVAQRLAVVEQVLIDAGLCMRAEE